MRIAFQLCYHQYLSIFDRTISWVILAEVLAEKLTTFGRNLSLGRLIR